MSNETAATSSTVGSRARSSRPYCRPTAATRRCSAFSEGVHEEVKKQASTVPLPLPRLRSDGVPVRWQALDQSRLREPWPPDSGAEVVAPPKGAAEFRAIVIPCAMNARCPLASVLYGHAARFAGRRIAGRLFQGQAGVGYKR